MKLSFKTKGKTWKEVVREDCQARKLNKEDDAMVSGRSYIMQHGKNNRHSVVE